MCSGGSSAYSVLTHEQIVDLLWADALRPLLLQRYPDLIPHVVPIESPRELTAKLARRTPYLPDISTTMASARSPSVPGATGSHSSK